MVVRILVGRFSDRIPSGHLRIAAALLGIGTIGILLLATGQPTAMMVGIALALSAAWGQPGVFWFSVVRFYADHPGRVTGLIAPANNVGSIVGPFVFGLLATGVGYGSAWLFCSVLAMGAVFAMLAGNRRMVALSGGRPEVA
jgi:predicted MFS family arabinose efflux permease